MDKRVGIGKPHRDGEEQRNSERGHSYPRSEGSRRQWDPQGGRMTQV